MSDHHDDWFQNEHDSEHMEAHGETNSLIIIQFLAGTILIVVVTIVLISQYFKVRVASIEDTMIESRSDQTLAQPALEAKSNWENTLSEPAWIDRNDGVVALPLDVAAQKVINEYN